MGYETKLFIVEKTNRFWTNQMTGEKVESLGEIIGEREMFYANLIATFDLCKCYAVSDVMRKYPDTDNYIYMDDGNTRIIEDRYGKPLKEIPLTDAIEIIDNAEIAEEYRRYAPCLALLESLQKHKKEWDEIVVLHYGY